MYAQRRWLPGDEYWALWIDATHRRYVAVQVGVVHLVEGNIVRMTNTDWRLVDEGLPFKSLADATHYIEENPFEDDEQAPPSGVTGRTWSLWPARDLSA